MNRYIMTIIAMLGLISLMGIVNAYTEPEYSPYYENKLDKVSCIYYGPFAMYFAMGADAFGAPEGLVSGYYSDLGTAFDAMESCASSEDAACFNAAHADFQYAFNQLRMLYLMYGVLDGYPDIWHDYSVAQGELLSCYNGELT